VFAMAGLGFVESAFAMQPLSQDYLHPTIHAVAAATVGSAGGISRRVQRAASAETEIVEASARAKCGPWHCLKTRRGTLRFTTCAAINDTRSREQA
jgi:hypothetical protein